ncbi:MAG: hypothetical protein ACOCRC_02915 [Halodesulfurarchaeum sp.]
MSEDEFATGPLDIPTLEILGQRAETHPLVERWAFKPDRLSPRRLEIRIDTRHFPAAVESVKLDVRWYEGGNYTFHYRESWTEADWQCRWDRHPKPDGPRCHFHPPPDASGAIEPSEFGQTHPLDVFFSVLDWVRDRIEQLHDT